MSSRRPRILCGPGEAALGLVGRSGGPIATAEAAGRPFRTRHLRKVIGGDVSSSKALQRTAPAPAGRAGSFIARHAVRQPEVGWQHSVVCRGRSAPDRVTGSESDLGSVSLAVSVATWSSDGVTGGLVLSEGLSDVLSGFARPMLTVRSVDCASRLQTARSIGTGADFASRLSAVMCGSRCGELLRGRLVSTLVPQAHHAVSTWAPR